MTLASHGGRTLRNWEVFFSIQDVCFAFVCVSLERR